MSKRYCFPSTQARDQFMTDLDKTPEWHLTGWTSNKPNQKGELWYNRTSRIEWKFSSASDILIDDSRLKTNAQVAGGENQTALESLETALTANRARER